MASAASAAAVAAITSAAKSVVGSATATNTSAIVRTILASSAATGTSSMRLSDIFTEVKKQVPSMSKTHFRESVLANMHVRGELRKKRTQIDGKSVYLLSLANTTKVKEYVVRDLALKESTTAPKKTAASTLA